MSLTAGLIDLVHPPVCLACDATLPGWRPGEDRRNVNLCSACRGALVRYPRCERCSLATGAPGCDLCRDERFEFPVRVFGSHEGVLRSLLVEAKWHRSGAILPVLADWCVDAARDEAWAAGCQLWAAVPRDPWRRLLHGTSLAEELAWRVGTTLRLRETRLRRRRRPPQARLTEAARRRNVEGTARVPRRERTGVEGRTVLLIDDVVTTGSTLRECARALTEAGAREIRALVLAHHR
ncbi:MAG: ComF family protein [Planctomycetes bacterium]|nr:ComF family protein [Planctomycetota bacterium]